MTALEWLKSQVFNILAPSYSAHLDAQRQKVAEYALMVQMLKKTQEKCRALVGRVQELDPELDNLLTEFGQNAQQVEQARKGVIDVVVKEDAALEKAWPEVERKMQILLRWVDFNEPGGVLEEVNRCLDKHHQALAQGIKIATLQARVDQAKKGTKELKALHKRAASSTDDLHRLAQELAKKVPEKEKTPHKGTSEVAVKV
jgi:chromosome segregation ATPase